jgi:hypothetical protein
MTPTRTALVLVVLAAATASDLQPSAAQPFRPWCVQYSGRGAAMTCTFHSYEQCRMTATPGSGGFCVRNPWNLWYGEGGQGTTGEGRRARSW